MAALLADRQTDRQFGRHKATNKYKANNKHKIRKPTQNIWNLQTFTQNVHSTQFQAER